jgi:hypothetical protein
MTIAPVSMNEVEARECAARIKKGLDSIRVDVFNLYERQGWRALGYSSWRECVSQEFEHSERHLYRLLTAAKVDNNVQQIDPWVKPLPERQARELAVLAPDEQKLVWQAVKETAPNGEPTAAHVKSLVKVAKELELTRAIDDGSGEMVPWEELNPERKLALLKANTTEETFERNMQQDERIKDRMQKKNAQGQWKDPSQKPSYVKPNDAESLKTACENLIQLASEYPNLSSFDKTELKRSLEQVNEIVGRYLA